MKEVHIFYSKIGDWPTIDRDAILLESLPKDILAKSKKYVNWQDRELAILGRLLLREGLKFYDCDLRCLEELKHTSYGRPYLDLEIDFNISHSGKYAICVLSREIRLGVDIEQRKTIDVSSYSEIFSQDELMDIISSKQPEKAFYNYWTIKESIIKAIGKGLSIPLKDVKVGTSQQVSYNNQIWYIQDLQIDDLYSSHIAMDNKDVKLNYHLVDYL